MISEFIRTTQLDLRNHFRIFPAPGEVDMYQVLLVMAAHNQRHTSQMVEVLAEYNAM